jgi:23S rRNA (uracil1939-C5)-methyltransferase
MDGKAVFIPRSLPGETLEIEITESRKDYSFARIVSVLEPSPRRVVPACPLFGVCGGCSLQMADHEYQKELRLSILSDLFSRTKIAPEDSLSMESGESLGYRSRFQFHRTQDGAIGLKEDSANSIVPVNDCPVAVAEIRAALRDGSLAAQARHANAGDRFHVFAHGGKLWQECGDTACSIALLGKNIGFDVRGFFQSNVPMLEKMIAAVSSGLSGERLLDFYSGVGTFSLFAGDSFRESVLVEHNREALTKAADNLAGVSCKPVFCVTNDERWPAIRESRLHFDAAIVDPPRQGLSPKALDWFVKSKIGELRYVSCDPATFVRDAAKLASAGFRFRKAVLFDFYPQTHHIETLGFFTR